jgi:hypothetical protein
MRQTFVFNAATWLDEMNESRAFTVGPRTTCPIHATGAHHAAATFNVARRCAWGDGEIGRPGQPGGPTPAGVPLGDPVRQMVTPV